MTGESASHDGPRCAPADARDWPALAKLFGANGACGGCWCMTWRKSRRDFQRDKGAGNQASLRALLERQPSPGVLAFASEEAVGWCAVAPRAEYVTLANSRVLRPVDARPVWSISCLFVDKDWRRRGLSKQLINAAADHAFAHGAEMVEGYPYDVVGDRPPLFVWTGLASAYSGSGFTEVARRSPTRPIMRRPRDSAAPPPHTAGPASS